MNDFITLKHRIKALDKKYNKCMQLLLLINIILFGIIAIIILLKETKEQAIPYIIILIIYIIINFNIVLELHLLSFDLSKYNAKYKFIEYYINKKEK